MRLQLQRRAPAEGAILGELWLDGAYLCWTLENAAHALAAGSYGLTAYHSPYFDTVVPLLTGTEPRSAIEIHPANWPSELKGCIAVGMTQRTTPPQVRFARIAHHLLMQKLGASLAAGECSLMIEEA